MNLTKNPLLSIGYSQTEGLQLSYNFRSSESTPIYFRNLFLPLKNLSENSLKLIKDFYKKMKPGEFIGMICEDMEVLWLEKSLLVDFQEEFLKFFQYGFDNDVGELVDLLAKLEKTFSEPIMCYVLEGKKCQFQQLGRRVGKCRADGHLQFIINFIGQTQNVIDHSSGVNCFSLKHTSARFFRWMLEQIALKKFQISIDCFSGQITPQKKDLWENQTFSKMRKCYYGPHKEFIKEKIVFMELNRSSHQMKVKVTINYTELSGVKFECSKILMIKLSVGSHYLKTAFQTAQGRDTDFCKDVYFLRLPQRTEEIVCYQEMDLEGSEIP